ncbi:MAG: gluconate:H+ symporter [Gemmatimonadaceae bacterium]
MIQGNLLLIYAAAAIVLLVILIAKFRLNPFVTLVIVSLTLGIAVGMPMNTIVKAFETGVGNALGHVAMVIALGAMLGKMLAESGGADTIAQTVIRVFGPRNVHWAMGCVAFIVGLPVFWDVGFVLLVPIAFTIAKRTGASMVLVGIPMAAGLSVVHGLFPPHPAALFAVNAYNADIGRTMLYGLIVGIPTAIIAGPVFAKLVSRYVIPTPNTALMNALTDAPRRQALPGFAITIITILLPVALILVGNWADQLASAGTLPNDVLKLAGNPVVALLLALLLSFYTLGRACGFNREDILKFTGDSVAPIALVTLVVGAGAGFGRILMDSGISSAVIGVSKDAHLSPLVLGWLVAALIRVATGSATVAMTTACGIVAPLAGASTGVSPELMVLATGAGSLTLSHVNDGGFWLVQQYFGLTVTQTFKTWTVAETLISVVGLLLTLALGAVV